MNVFSDETAFAGGAGVIPRGVGGIEVSYDDERGIIWLIACCFEGSMKSVLWSCGAVNVEDV